jgi:hypothetical protein
MLVILGPAPTRLVDSPSLGTQRPSVFEGAAALGVARADSQLLNEATARFEAMGLEWDAGETRKLVMQS